MAARSIRGRVPYSLLHNLSSVDLLYDEIKESKKKTKTIGIFEAERVVAQKRDREVKYLLKNTSKSVLCSIRYFGDFNATLCIYYRETNT